MLWPAASPTSSHNSETFFPCLGAGSFIQSVMCLLCGHTVKNLFSFRVVLMFEVKLRVKFDSICVVHDTNRRGLTRKDN